jgi:hypothetical protein
MGLRKVCRQLLQRLAGRRLPGRRPQRCPAGPAPPRAPVTEQPYSACPRPVSCSAYCGDEWTVAYTLTYRCPRCGKPGVGHGFRMADAC